MSKLPVFHSQVVVAVNAADLITELRELIHSARQRVATVANAEQTLLYWQLGRRLRTQVLGDDRAAYGEQIVVTVSRQLETEFGKGFGEKNVRRMIQFAELFPDEHIIVSLIQHLSWSHFLALLPIKTPLAREFYAEMCRVERWPVRTLRQKIGGMLYERTALSRNTPAVNNSLQRPPACRFWPFIRC